MHGRPKPSGTRGHRCQRKLKKPNTGAPAVFQIDIVLRWNPAGDPVSCHRPVTLFLCHLILLPEHSHQHGNFKAIHPKLAKTSYCEPKMSTCSWRLIKSQGINKVTGIHRLESTNVCTKFCPNPSGGCEGISLTFWYLS